MKQGYIHLNDEKVLFITDPGHGWLRVPISHLDDERMDIAGRVTDYSYQSGWYVYLEEDCDLSLYLDTRFPKGDGETDEERMERVKAWMNTVPEERHPGDCYVRAFPRFHSGRAT